MKEFESGSAHKENTYLPLVGEIEDNFCSQTNILVYPDQFITGKCIGGYKRLARVDTVVLLVSDTRNSSKIHLCWFWRASDITRTFYKGLKVQ